MPAPKRTKKQRETDLYHIAQMYCRRMPLKEIAAGLVNITGSELSPSQIHFDLKLIKKRWAEETYTNINERITWELSKIELVESEAYKSWLDSKSKKRKVSEKASMQSADQLEVDDDGELRNAQAVNPVGLIERTVTEEESVGDPRFLDIMMKCVNRRIQLLGLDAPKRIAIEGKTDKGDQDEIDEKRAEILMGLFNHPAEKPDKLISN